MECYNTCGAECQEDSLVVKNARVLDGLSTVCVVPLIFPNQLRLVGLEEDIGTGGRVNGLFVISDMYTVDGTGSGRFGEGRGMAGRV